MHQDHELSIILPVHNEETAIGPLLRDIISVVRDILNQTTEIIVVDDASNDNSIIEIEKIIAEIDRLRNEKKSGVKISLRVISLSSHSGQAQALREGFNAAEGKLLLSMDADGQHDPADIPRFFEIINSYDMICGVRNHRTDGLARMVCSRIANGFRNFITGDCLKDAGCTFRLMRSECRNSLTVFREHSIDYDFFFHPLFIRSGGFRVGEINIAHRKRFAGRSNYHLVQGRLQSGIRVCMQARKLLKKI